MALEFEDKYNEFQRFSGEESQPRLVSFLIKHRLARDERDANKKALIAAVAIIVISLGLTIWAYAKSNTKQKLYNFPDALISRLPLELQIKIQSVIYAAKK